MKAGEEEKKHFSEFLTGWLTVQLNVLNLVMGVFVGVCAMGSIWAVVEARSAKSIAIEASQKAIKKYAVLRIYTNNLHACLESGKCEALPTLPPLED